MPAQQFHKTRIAPTPSGFLHLGNAMSFALTAKLATQTGAKVLLRIDDLDQERVNDEYVQDIFDTLNFLGINWDEGPRNFAEYKAKWSQMHRIDLYRSALDQLKKSGQVYACTCSRIQIKSCTCYQKHLPFNTPQTTWRLRTPADTTLNIKNLNQGVITVNLPQEMVDFVVKKKDGYPSYQLASVIDDLYFGIDLVIRGEDLWASTIAQHHLAKVLHKPQFADITFHHHALVMADDDKKLSKSAGATSIKYLRKTGDTKEDIYVKLKKMLFLPQLMDFWIYKARVR